MQEEVRRLPQKYRTVVVLCYWEGLTQEQAAVHSASRWAPCGAGWLGRGSYCGDGWPAGGLAPLAGMVAAGLEGLSASLPRLTAVPVDLVKATIRAAGHVAARQATNPVVSAVVASLVKQCSGA